MLPALLEEGNQSRGGRLENERGAIPDKREHSDQSCVAARWIARLVLQVSTMEDRRCFWC